MDPSHNKIVEVLAVYSNQLDDLLADRTVISSYHPDTHVKMEGFIKDYESLKKTVLGIASHLSLVEYMGFDICVTDKGFKCLEINSHPGIKYMQVFKPFLANVDTREYYGSKIDKINGLSDELKKKRNSIVR